MSEEIIEGWSIESETAYDNCRRGSTSEISVSQESFTVGTEHNFGFDVQLMRESIPIEVIIRLMQNAGFTVTR